MAGRKDSWMLVNYLEQREPVKSKGIMDTIVGKGETFFILQGYDQVYFRSFKIERDKVVFLKTLKFKHFEANLALYTKLPFKLYINENSFDDNDLVSFYVYYIPWQYQENKVTTEALRFGEVTYKDSKL